MQIIKRLHIVFFCCICSFFSYAEESPGGLLFTSSAEKVDKRTSLVLFGDKLRKFEDSLCISFDLSIWDINQFGHIFRIINDQKQEVEFVFVNFYGINRMYLDFHSPITHTSVQIPVTKEDIDQKASLHLDICLNLEEDRASITLKDSIYTCALVGLENPSLLQFTFGLYGLNLDVPQMLIRNLRVQAANGKSLFFPLGEPEGEYAYDRTGKIKAPVKNPEWIVNRHFYWQAQSTFNINRQACVAYDEANNRILILNSDSIVCYYPRYDKTESHKFGHAPMNDAIYNPYLRQCYLLCVDAETASLPAVRSDDLTIVRLHPSDEKNTLHHNSFFSSTGDLYQFGGYGNHSYSDKLSLYNMDEQKWEFVDLSGDEMTPRFYSAVGDGVQPDEKLIFGGFGNRTGKQEHGGQNLYDLHLLNLKQKTMTRLWNIEELPETEFIPGSNLILSEDKMHFYALCYAHHIPKTFGYLYRFNIQNGTYSIMSDSIRLISEDMNTSVNLFYNKQLNEFYAVIREFSEENGTQVRIYSLLSPPITKLQLESSVPVLKSGRIAVWVLVSTVFFAAIYLACHLFRKRRIKLKADKNFHLPLEYIPEKNMQTTSLVHIFGNFTVLDKNGMDISYRFSMKMRTLFALVLLNMNHDTGISTEKLTSTLWPDKDVNEAKSIRGVTISRLRNILADIEGISLVHQNSQWIFVFDQPFYCDYLEYSDILSLLQHSGQESYPALMEYLIAIVRRGLFLLDVQDAAIDSYKSIEEEKLRRLLKEHILHLFGEKQYQKAILVAQYFFSIEPLNEEILDVCIKSYNKLGKEKKARGFLENYKQTYEILTGEEYKEKHSHV